MATPDIRDTETENSYPLEPKLFDEAHPVSHTLKGIFKRDLALYQPHGEPLVDLGFIYFDINPGENSHPIQINYRLENRIPDDDTSAQIMISTRIVPENRLKVPDLNPDEVFTAWREYQENFCHKRNRFKSGRGDFETGLLKYETNPPGFHLIAWDGDIRIESGLHNTDPADLVKSAMGNFARVYPDLRDFFDKFLPFFHKRSEALRNLDPDWLKSLIDGQRFDTDIAFIRSESRMSDSNPVTTTVGVLEIPSYENGNPVYVNSDGREEMIPFIASCSTGHTALSFELVLNDADVGKSFNKYLVYTADGQNPDTSATIKKISEEFGKYSLKRMYRLNPESEDLKAFVMFDKNDIPDIQQKDERLKFLGLGIQPDTNEAGQTKIVLGFSANAEILNLLNMEGISDPEIIEKALSKLSLLYPLWKEFVDVMC
jgi:hypothetical protein